MEERVEAEKADDMMLPGFRFHPTDEELVGFYLRRKIQKRPLPVELIKQVDIYKHDPWDLPKVAASGEKEWYFYCPRDRKYRNSARPNRVTGAGFWKATGTDRPIYSSSDPSNCIGLKKSLVFYRGRAAKGFKTDWMMHEFRLPSLPPSVPPSTFSRQSFPPDDSWAICRIFKKTSSVSQRAISQSWMTPFLEPTTYITTKLSPDNISSPPTIRSPLDLEQVSNGSFSALDFPSFKQLNHLPGPPLFPGNFCNGFTIPPLEVSGLNKCAFNSAPPYSLQNSIDLIQGAESVGFEGGVQEQPEAFSISFSNEMAGYEEGLRKNGDGDEAEDDSLPFSLSSDDAWKSGLEWDSPPFTSEMSTSCSATKCYT